MAKKHAFGASLKMGNAASPEVFTAIANVVGISGPAISVDTVDVSDHGSPSAYKEYVAGMLDGGEVTLEINWDETQTTHKNATGGILKKMVDRTLTNWQVIDPNASTTLAAFAAYVTGFEPDLPSDGKKSASLTLKVSGPVTLPSS